MTPWRGLHTAFISGRLIAQLCPVNSLSCDFPCPICAISRYLSVGT